MLFVSQSNIVSILLLIITGVATSNAGMISDNRDMFLHAKGIIVDVPNWNGTWRGSLTNYPSRGPSPAVDVLLELGPFPVSDNTCTMWRYTYTESGKAPLVKDYRLCRGDGADDLFIDEGDGTKLAAQWIGDVLITPFKYDNLLLIDSMRVRDDVLEEEILTADDKHSTKGVVSLRARGIQRIQAKRTNLSMPTTS